MARRLQTLLLLGKEGRGHAGVALEVLLEVLLEEELLLLGQLGGLPRARARGHCQIRLQGIGEGLCAQHPRHEMAKAEAADHFQVPPIAGPRVQECVICGGRCLAWPRQGRGWRLRGPGGASALVGRGLGLLHHLELHGRGRGGRRWAPLGWDTRRIGIGPGLGLGDGGGQLLCRKGGGGRLWALHYLCTCLVLLGTGWGWRWCA